MKNVEDILRDKGLASFGDSLVNFLFSLTVTRSLGKPTGLRMDNKILAEAVRRSRLRSLIPRRTDRKAAGDYAEAIIAYAWLEGIMTTDGFIKMLMNDLDNPANAFKNIIEKILEDLMEHADKDS
ncbi:hypothetical protein KEJ27_02960 [Candidatus Bathyarchaeota archaeon]|nr:hypothetical protein [Candidatus Bathyarchaeota archaeon]MBS7613570.1 hypothetical protein [Candidatus Bathyarchaeota archaeon]MBS7618613.1 hypothetical protein [Candidatus Bathyarchaeota archaeon]